MREKYTSKGKRNYEKQMRFRMMNEISNDQKEGTTVATRK